MGDNQVIRLEIKPDNQRRIQGHPGLVKIRRKLGLTFVLSNSFHVPVAQSSAALEEELDLQVEVVHRAAKAVMAEQNMKLNYMVGTMIEVPHGFTTREDGHGFGLHSAALAAQEMGGTLTPHSDGVGRGATFRLELPIQPPAKSRELRSQPAADSRGQN